MLSDLPFASHFAYSPRGTSEAAAQSRRIRDLLKQNRRVGVPPVTAAERFARRLRQAVERGDYGDFFDPAAALVPAPRSSLLLPGALWPALELAAALAAERLGARVLLPSPEPSPPPVVIRAGARSLPRTASRRRASTGTRVALSGLLTADQKLFPRSREISPAWRRASAGGAIPPSR